MLQKYSFGGTNSRLLHPCIRAWSDHFSVAANWPGVCLGGFILRAVCSRRSAASLLGTLELVVWDIGAADNRILPILHLPSSLSPCCLPLWDPFLSES